MAVPKNKIKIYKDSRGQYYEFISCFKGYDYDGIVKRQIFGDPEGMKVNCCPFCDTLTTGGSWIPDSCPNCGAIEFMESWTRNIDYDPVNKKEETTSGLISIIKNLIRRKKEK